MTDTSTAAALDLVIACGDYAHTRALTEGLLQVEHVSTSFVKLAAGDMLTYTFEAPQFNVAELSLSNYVTRRLRGDCPYVALPVYTQRSFRHAEIYVRTDRGIATPRDLRGRRVAIKAYESTGSVWTRGMLEQEYQVAPADMRWVCLNAFRPPPGVSIVPAPAHSTLSELLERGDVDAVVSPQVPACFEHGAPHIARLFHDPAAASFNYFSRTQLFPILQVMGIRNELVERHPQLAADVYRAFLAARNLAFGPVPGTVSDLRAARGPAFDARYYTYGLGERDRETLDTFLDYHFEQGLSQRRCGISELFAPVPLSAYTEF